MNLKPNPDPPRVMHVDLDSCFASIEQQANPLLRGKPMVVAPFDSLGSCAISVSLEAKRVGIKTGMRLKEAKTICPSLKVREPDPDKYRDVYRRFVKIFRSFTPEVFPKSIDEAVLNFEVFGSNCPDLINVGREIKKEIKRKIGKCVGCSVGIGTNRFLAKMAASADKPDGLLKVDNQKLKEFYQQFNLVDLHGIRYGFKRRINRAGIYSPVELFEASVPVLKKQVFKSINGYYWYLRLRGWEIDKAEFSRKGFGQSYALPYPENQEDQVLKIICKLTQKLGQRLRENQYSTRGLKLKLYYPQGLCWHQRLTLKQPVMSSFSIYDFFKRFFKNRPEKRPVVKVAIRVFKLFKTKPEQLSLLEGKLEKQRSLQKTVDRVNHKFGEYTLHPARMISLGNQVVDRIAFGQV